MDNPISPQHHTFLILDNIRSVYNVGAIFRTADAVGVSKMYLCGTTPVPIDRFGRARQDLAKTALGAEKTVAWEYCESSLACVEKLKGEGVEIIAVEQDSRAIPYASLKKEEYAEKVPTIAFVFGDEVRGVSPEVLDLADTIIDIPMRGKKESLNVSVAVGVVLYQQMPNQNFQVPNKSQ